MNLLNKSITSTPIFDLLSTNNTVRINILMAKEIVPVIQGSTKRATEYSIQNSTQTVIIKSLRFINQSNQTMKKAA